MSPPTLLPPIRMTCREFDAWARDQVIPYELIDGRVEPKYLSDDGLEPMATDKIAPRLVASNLLMALHARRPSGCSVLAGASVQAGADAILRPDASLTGEALAEEQLHLVEPRLVADVLSSWTRRQERSARFAACRLASTIEEIWLVRTRPRHVEVWQRRPDGWHVADVIGTGTIQSRVLQAPVPLDELYEGLPA